MFLAREPLKATQTPQVWEESSESSDMQWVWEDNQNDWIDNKLQK